MQKFAVFYSQYNIDTRHMFKLRKCIVLREKISSNKLRSFKFVSVLTTVCHVATVHLKEPRPEKRPVLPCIPEPRSIPVGAAGPSEGLRGAFTRHARRSFQTTLCTVDAENFKLKYFQ